MSVGHKTEGSLIMLGAIKAARRTHFVFIPVYDLSYEKEH